MTSLGIRCLEGFNGGLTQSFMLEVRDMSTQVNIMGFYGFHWMTKMALIQIESHTIHKWKFIYKCLRWETKRHKGITHWRFISRDVVRCAVIIRHN